MKTLIYQCWLGQRPEYSYVSEAMFRDYAKMVGADYHFTDKPFPKRCFHKQYFGTLTPVYDSSFHDYDAVFYVDMDVIPVEGVQENVFDDVQGDLMITEELDQPELRLNMPGQINAANDQKWMTTVERLYGNKLIKTDDGKPKIFNAGAIMFSGDGMRKLRKEWPNILMYQIFMKLRGLPRFYSHDQNFSTAFLQYKSIDFQHLDPKWNSQVTLVTQRNGEKRLLDYRNAETNFIHMQHGARKPKMTRDEVLDVARGKYAF